MRQSGAWPEPKLNELSELNRLTEEKHFGARGRFAQAAKTLGEGGTAEGAGERAVEDLVRDGEIDAQAGDIHQSGHERRGGSGRIYPHAPRVEIPYGAFC